MTKAVELTQTRLRLRWKVQLVCVAFNMEVQSLWQTTSHLCNAGFEVQHTESCLPNLMLTEFLNSFSDLMRLSDLSVTFLPLDSLHKLPEKNKYSHFFNTIYLSARWELLYYRNYYIHHLTAWIFIYIYIFFTLLSHWPQITDINADHVSLCVSAVKLRAPVGPDDDPDCSTRRCGCHGVGQVRVL